MVFTRSVIQKRNAVRILHEIEEWNRELYLFFVQ